MAFLTTVRQLPASAAMASMWRVQALRALADLYGVPAVARVVATLEAAGVQFTGRAGVRLRQGR